MNPLIKSSTKVLIIDKMTDALTVDEKVNIILTPSYYWIKRADVDETFTYAALKYAPSVFEGILPDNDQYSYYALKKNGEYLFFAYNPDAILESLSSKGLDVSQIANVYFAQNELKDANLPMYCNENEVLLYDEEILLQLPVSIMSESSIHEIDIEEVKDLSKHKITLLKRSTIDLFNELTPFMYVLGALLILYSAQFLFNHNEKLRLQALPSTFEEYDLPRTFMQNKSIEKKLLSDFQYQSTFRKVVHSVLSLPLDQRQHINSLSYDKGLFKINFEIKTSTNLKTIKQHLTNTLGELADVKIATNTITVKVSS